MGRGGGGRLRQSLIAGISGLRVVPSYFIERHGSVIIIALGETIIELGGGGQPKTCAVPVSSALWFSGC